MFRLISVSLLFLHFSSILAQSNDTSSTNPSNSTAGQSNSQVSFISSVPFQNYEAFCPDDGPVTVFQYKQIRVENERDALLFNATKWPGEDYVLKASCFDLKKFFGQEWINVSSTAQCRLGESFEAGQTVWDNDPTHMCKKGEYINGASSEYVNGTRMIKIRCCKMDEFDQSDSSDCFYVPNDQRFAQMFMNHRPNCKVDILTAITVSRGDDRNVGVKARYCGFEREGFKADPFCAVKRRIEMKQAHNGPEPSPEEESMPIDISLEGGVKPGEKTPSDGTFDFACPKFQAINRMNFEEANGGLVFTFDCANVTSQQQSSQDIRYTDYQPFPDSDDQSAGCEYHSSEVLCAVKSYISPKESKRQYSFGCCQMSNLAVIDSRDEELRYADLKQGRLNAPVSDKGKFLHRFRVEKSPDGKGNSLVTAWSAYNYVNQSPIRRKMNMNSAGQISASILTWIVMVMAKFVLN